MAATLAGAGVDHVFGVVGSGNFEVTNGLVECGARYVAARHEGGAIVMADAFARVTGRLAVCSVHQGPGFTNILTGLTEAAKSRTPLLVLAGDTSGSAIRSNFRIDQAAVVAALGALPERLHSAESAVADVLRAHRRAVVEQRPVVVSMPIDVQAQPAPEVPVAAPAPSIVPPRPSEAALTVAATLLAAGRRPLIIAGRGAVRAHARAAIEALGDRLGALLATSAAGHGLLTGNPWALGISGGFASPVAADLIRQADVVLALGATLNMWTTRHGRLLDPAATLIQVDVEADAIGSQRPVQAALLGDAAEAARALAGYFEAGGPDRPGWRTSQVAERIRHGGWRETPYEDAGGAGRIDPRTLTIRLDRLLPVERTLAIDSGHFMGWPSMYMRVPDESGFVFTQSFQAVGLGLASSIGAVIGRPERLAVAALGDGGMLMGISELETAVRLGLRLLVVVYNDAAYGAEVHHFGPGGRPLEIVRFPDTDFASLARGLGAQAATVREAGDLAAVEAWLSSGEDGVFVVDAKVVPTVVGEWLPEAFGH